MMVAGENLLAQLLMVKYQQPLRRTICPICGYPLEETERGLHCRFDAWSESPVPMRYIPRTPDTPQS
jgi:hypothetical protein